MTVPRELVLVGGGHSHVQVLRRLLMKPLTGIRVTVVVDRPEAVYSGMVPGVVAGAYARHEVTLDVRPLARRSGCRVLHAACTGIDPGARRLHLEGRPDLSFDLCSINVGSQVASLTVPGAAEHAVPTRPIGRFVARMEAALANRSVRDVVVVGSGAAGVELAFCIDARLRKAGLTPRVTLVGASPHPLPRRGPRAEKAVRAAAAQRGITLIDGVRVEAVSASTVTLTGGTTLPADHVLWVTGAAPASWLSSLPTDPRGFVQVDDTLQVTGHEGIFAVGDCAVIASWPEIPKAGVYAVRQGPVLADNLAALGEGRPLRRYRPQRDFLTLLDLGDGTAIGLRNGLAWRGRGTRRLKERIDRAFMEKFQVLDPSGGQDTPFSRDMPTMDDSEMVCGGCAAKVGQGPLSRALARVGSRPDAEVTLGLAEPDDVAVLQRPGEQLVTSIDAFPAFVDDPWMVGRVAADNAMSDLFAKGVVPRLALAIVTVPEDEEPEEVLVQVLAGARDALDAAETTLAGGHTTVGERLSVGFAVTGFAPNDQAVLKKGGLAPGDLLVLTRPLGTGVLFHADMAGRAAGPWIDAALAGLLQGNRAAAAVALAQGAHASTDITGFGLAGHAAEMAVASGCRVQLALSALPALPGAIPLLQRGERSTFHEQNREGLRGMSVGALPEEAAAALELAFDPQTLGGLLIGIPDDRAEALLAALRASGHPDAVVVGRAEPSDNHPSPLHLAWELETA